MSEPVWRKGGILIGPSSDVEWLAGGAGPCFAVPDEEDRTLLRLYVSGRDRHSRSRIGMALFSTTSGSIVEVKESALLPLGRRGTFDENGTSYPSVARTDTGYRMYFTGWIRGVHVPWYNDLGLAESRDGISFRRVSDSPAMARTHLDALGIGSCFVMNAGGSWRIWYTRFDRWGESESDARHYYDIRHAVSEDGLNWNPDPEPCVTFDRPGEYAIAKPCVRVIGGKWFMWYSHRGTSYRAGLAFSEDGVNWARMDDRVGIDVSPEGWDSQMICYPHVIECDGTLFMFYCGNRYGVDGLGFARMEVSDLMSLTAF